MRFEHLISSESMKLKRLHEAVRKTARQRSNDKTAHEAWKKACSQFHTYRSSLEPYLTMAREEASSWDQDTTEFVIAFLEIDPRFYRSGYIKEEMLSRIAAVDMTKKQNARLRSVLIDAVDHRGGREYRRYCRLAAKVYDDELVRELRGRSSNGGAAESRSKLMLRYIDQAQRGVESRLDC